MKKIISVFLCALMLAAMFCLPASAANELAKGYDAAKDGELLYDVVFNAKDGAYTPDVISRDTDKNTTADVKFSADGKEVTITHDNVDVGRYWWGGQVKGLELGEGKNYTLTGKVKLTGTNAGVYFNANEDGKTYKNLFGWYGGRNDKNHMTLVKAGSKIKGTVMVDGKLKCDGKAYATFDFKAAENANADGYARFSIVIEGYTYSVYFNGELFDKRECTAKELDTSTKIGIVFYVYNVNNTSITAKDFKLYKGVKLGADSGSTGSGRRQGQDT